MTVKDLTYISIKNFKNRKSRVFFTVLGVAIAIAVVLTLVSFGYGLQKNILNQITTEDAMLTLDVYPPDSKIIALTDQALNKIRHVTGVDIVSPEATLNGEVTYNGVISEVSVYVVKPDFFILDGRAPITGSFFTESDSKKLVISSVIPRLFNAQKADMLGKNLQIKTIMPVVDSTSSQDVIIGGNYVVSGIVDSSNGTGQVYISSADFPRTLSSYASAKVKVKNQSDIENVRNQLINMGYVVSALSDVVSQANRIFGAVQITLGIFGTFALIVAAIGLVNTMTISLLERTNEIGIMRAIGASPNDIRKIFLGESVMIGFFGGLFGIAFGFIGSEFLNWLFNIISVALGGAEARLFAYPLWFIIFIMVLSTFVGFTGGLWPAERAARMNPLSALRYK